MLTVVIPAYNEEPMIQKTGNVISQIMNEAEIPYELLFVNDGSKDGTWREIQSLAKANECVKGIRFSRNFGKEPAIFAGLAEAQGDCAVIIDCDLQQPPEKIVEMYRLWEEGYEVVEGVKSSRGKESVMHRTAANCFYQFMSGATGINMANASDFKLLDRKVIDALILIPEKNAFFRALSSWVGFKTAKVEYDVRERQAGETKWSTVSLIKYALINISSFTTAPMQIVTLLGVITFFMSLVLSVCTLYQKIKGVALGGFTTVIIMTGFIGSIIMISLGIIGYYIAKIYEEIKGHPKYIIAEKTE